MENEEVMEQVPPVDTPNNNYHDGQPILTHEQYTELSSIKARLDALKVQSYDLQKYINEFDNQKQRAIDKLNELEMMIRETNDQQSIRYQEFIQPFGIEGPISVSDSEPHYIKSGLG